MIIEIFVEYGLFLAKTVTIAAALIFVFGGIISLLLKSKTEKKDAVQVIDLNKKYQDFAKTIENETLPKHLLKQKRKKEKAEEKQSRKKGKKEQDHRNRLFVLDFDGDIKASAVDALKEEITAVLTVAKEGDEVLLRLESSGGMVHSYGLAASQLLRVKKREIPLMIAVDKVAASGGYMMASVADHIMAAPFAIIGSIGVIAQLPNFNRLLKKYDVDYEQVTAGEFKRTLTVFGENKEEHRDKLKQELEETHTLFKEFVVQGRKELDIDAIATGEHWYGSKAQELKLVDELITSDDYLLSKSRTMDLFLVTYEVKRSLSEKLVVGLRGTISELIGHRGTSIP